MSGEAVVGVQRRRGETAMGIGGEWASEPVWRVGRPGGAANWQTGGSCGREGACAERTRKELEGRGS